jgi:3-oxoacyl-[acyl-carrier-protein] synthase III
VTRAGIVGMGLWVPEVVRGNDAWGDAFVRAHRKHIASRLERDFTQIEATDDERPYNELFVRHAGPHEADPFKGAKFRRIADPNVPTIEGDARACRAALADANIEPRDIDLILSSALIQDALVPSNGPAIQDIVGCVRAPGIGVEGYCSSSVAQLDLAAGIVEAGRARFVLCVQSHQINRVNDMSLPSSPIFGDGSGAFVVGQVPEGSGLTHLVRGGDGALRRAVTLEFHTTPGATWWRDGSGPVVPGTDDPVAARRLVRSVLTYPIETIRELCSAAELSCNAIDVLSMIQPVAWYQAAVADGLGIDLRRVPSTHSEYAHLGGAAIVANLLEARRLGMLRGGSNVVLYAHGAGLTRYAALLKWPNDNGHSAEAR